MRSGFRGFFRRDPACAGDFRVARQTPGTVLGQDCGCDPDLPVGEKTFGKNKGAAEFHVFADTPHSKRGKADGDQGQEARGNQRTATVLPFSTGRVKSSSVTGIPPVNRGRVAGAAFAPCCCPV